MTSKNAIIFSVAIVGGMLLADLGCGQQKNHEGAELARQYCGSCHLLPEPDMLDKTTWSKYVLPKMAAQYGYRVLEGNSYIREGTATIEMPPEAWNAILRYYLSAAPEHPLENEDLPEIVRDSTLFDLLVPASPVKNPATTLTLIDTASRSVIFGDGFAGKVYMVRDGYTIADSAATGLGIAHLARVGDQWLGLTMGVLSPSDDKKGQLATVRFDGAPSQTILDTLQRPVHASYADLNNDGLQDIVVCEFGDSRGSLSWYERLADNSFRRHVLRPLPGAIRTRVLDMDGDGRNDVVALMAQADEGVFIYYNEGAGHFREERVLRFSPCYGSNYFELADINQDGFPDLVTTHGDNGDYPPILKRYHGIRVSLNDGHNHFTEKLFLPVNGVGKAMVRDFDGDGDPDIASIAYFPDYEKRPDESFILWKNEGNLHFKPYTFPGNDAGRWITMDAGDVDGDGDVDIVLGNANFRLGNIPKSLSEKWDRFSPSVVILKNRLHRP